VKKHGQGQKSLLPKSIAPIALRDKKTSELFAFDGVFDNPWVPKKRRREPSPFPFGKSFPPLQ
jgi:hypothetical protein